MIEYAATDLASRLGAELVRRSGKALKWCHFVIHDGKLCLRNKVTGDLSPVDKCSDQGFYKVARAVEGTAERALGMPRFDGETQIGSVIGSEFLLLRRLAELYRRLCETAARGENVAEVLAEGLPKRDST
jgi:hypothetical protein